MFKTNLDGFSLEISHLISLVEREMAIFFTLIQLEIKNIIAYNEFRQFLLSNLFYTNVVIFFPTRKNLVGFFVCSCYTNFTGCSRNIFEP